MRPKFRLTAKGLFVLASLTITVSAIVTVMSGLWVLQQTRTLVETWQTLDTVPTAKAVVLSDLKDVASYGGVLDQLRNSVLRRDLLPLSTIRATLKHVGETLTRYETLGVTTAEQESVNAFRTAVVGYEANIDTAAAMIAAGKTGAEIERAVSIDNRPAFTALTRLSDILNESRSAGNKMLATRGEHVITISIYSDILRFTLLVAVVIGFASYILYDLNSQTAISSKDGTTEAFPIGKVDATASVSINASKITDSEPSITAAEIVGQIKYMHDATIEAGTTMSKMSITIDKMAAMVAALAVAAEQDAMPEDASAPDIETAPATTMQMARAMAHVLNVSDTSDPEASDAASGEAGISHETENLQRKFDKFMMTAPSETDERRRYKRIPGNDSPVMLRVQGRETRAALRDISRGGAALGCDWTIAEGTMVEVELPNSAGKVTARVVRSNGGEIGLVFGGSPSNLARVDRTLDSLTVLSAAS